MKTNVFLMGFLFLLTSFVSQAQKKMNEGTIIYNMSVETGSGEPKMADMLDGATTTVYIKGNLSKVELVSGLGKEATIYNASSKNGAILKDYSGQKLMYLLNDQDWKNRSNKYSGITFENTGETKNISGYNCKKAVAKLKNGTTFIVYYTSEVVIANKSYDPQFETLPGLPIQYEMESGSMKFKFTLASISFDAVPASILEIPKSGYRLMPYENSKK